ncbi:phosphoribosyl-ATP diphosphatase [Candidatus Vidania fulgoroideorum]
MISTIIKKIKKSLKHNKKSYSKKLLNNKKILIRKIIEECIEYITEFKANNNKKILQEFCDLLYHILLPILKYKINFLKIKKEIKNRFTPD